MAKTTNTYKKCKSGGASSEDSRKVGLDDVHVADADVKGFLSEEAWAEPTPVDEAPIEAARSKPQIEVAHVDKAYHINEAQAQTEQVLHNDIELQVKEKPSKNVFRFMDLPRELREVVYDEAWKDTPHIKAPYLDFGVGITAQYDHPLEGDQESEGLPTWLLTSKQMCEEGLVQFRLRAQWSIHGFQSVQVEDLLRKFGSEVFDLVEENSLLDLWMGLSKDTSKTSPYLRPSMAHDIVFNNGYLYQGVTYKINGKSLVDFAQVAPLFNESSKLKVLRLPVSFSFSKGPRTTTLDLSFLDTLSLPQLQTFEFEIFGDDDEVSTAMKQSDFRQVFEAEVLRVGRLLVGCEGRLSVKEEKRRVREEMMRRRDDGGPTFEDEDVLYWTFNFTAVGK